MIGPNGTYQFLQAADNGLRPDPTHHFVDVAADLSGALNPADVKKVQQANFRIWLIGAVTHGYTALGGTLDYQTWVDTMANQLKEDGYDAAVTEHWEGRSSIPLPGYTQSVGQEMADKVEAAAKALNPGRNDVVDVQFIGHSRGSVVISQALEDLQNTAFTPLKKGYRIMTMLDPHPASIASTLLLEPQPGHLPLPAQSCRE